MSRVSSDVGAAQAATAGVQAVDIDAKETIVFYDSKIAGMDAGRDVANELLDDITMLIDCVKEQSNKFNELATARAEADKSDQQSFNKED